MQQRTGSMDSFKPRSILYVPGDSPKKLAKAAGVPADGFIIDWEDAVAEDRKDAARVATIDAIPSLLDQGRYVLVRRNPSPGVFADADAEALRECAPHGVVIPKCDAIEDIEPTLSELPDSVMVFAMIESPKGLYNAYAIARCSSRVGVAWHCPQRGRARASLRSGPCRERRARGRPRGVRLTFHAVPRLD